MFEKLKKTIQFWINEGVEVTRVEESERDLRLAICQGCKKFNKTTRTCAVCGCNMDVKASLLYDPVQSISNGEQTLTRCPDGFW